ncbi:HD-GYP domain-containing protein, partial [Streptomyces palmae]
GAGPGPGGLGREPAPLAAVGALAYALLEGASAGRGAADAVLQAVAVLAAAELLGTVPHVARGHRAAVDRLARRLLTAAFTATCCQPLALAGGLTGGSGSGSYRLGYLLLLLVLVALCDAVLAALSAWTATGRPYPVLLADELRALPGAGAAVGATGLVTALAVSVAGLWALPVVCVPLLLSQYSCRRYAEERATHVQTIASLARATEIAGYTPAGHARTVAALSLAVGRELGLGGRELALLEHAALMHDIGQLSLVDPVPGGATERLTAAEQRRIALLGGTVVRQTGAPAQVAVIVERQAAPYREQPLTARIVRVANAYTELVGPGGHPTGPESLTATENASDPGHLGGLGSAAGPECLKGAGSAAGPEHLGGFENAPRAGENPPYPENPSDPRAAGHPGGPGSATGPGAALWALERLRLATARDFDPAVVAALTRVLVGGVSRG